MIWVIGGSGMLGHTLTALLKNNSQPFIATDMEVDITDNNALENFYTQQEDINWIVNCSAYTNVDLAEDEKEAAFLINETGVANIGQLAASHDIPVIHISTDYVFPGNISIPRKEDDPTGPEGIYGQSKLAGEEKLRLICKKHFILRTAWLYGLHGKNFVKTMLRLFSEKEQLEIVNDQTGSPTWTNGLADAVFSIIKSNNPAYGTYHYSDEGSTTWMGFAEEIQKLGKTLGLVPGITNILPVSSDRFPSKVKRPAYSLLNKAKICSTFNIQINTWQSNLQRYLEEEKNHASIVGTH